MNILPFSAEGITKEERIKHMSDYLAELNDCLSLKEKNIDITDMCFDLAEMFKGNKAKEIVASMGKSGEDTGIKCDVWTKESTAAFSSDLYDEETGGHAEYEYTVAQIAANTPWGAFVSGHVEGLKNPVWDILIQFAEESYYAIIRQINGQYSRGVITEAERDAALEACDEDFRIATNTESGEDIDFDNLDIDWAIKYLIHFMGDPTVAEKYQDESYPVEDIDWTEAMFLEWWGIGLDPSEATPDIEVSLAREIKPPLRTLVQIPLDFDIAPLKNPDITKEKYNRYLIYHHSAGLQLVEGVWSCILDIPDATADVDIIKRETGRREELQYNLLRNIGYIRISATDYYFEKAYPSSGTPYTESDNTITVKRVGNLPGGNIERVTIQLKTPTNPEKEAAFVGATTCEIWGYGSESTTPSYIMTTNCKRKCLSVPSPWSYRPVFDDWWERDIYYPDDSLAATDSFYVHFFPLIKIQSATLQEVVFEKDDDTISFDFMVIGSSVTPKEEDEEEEEEEE